MKRVIAYIDGFNLYHGLRSKCFPENHWDKPWRNYYWLDLEKWMGRYLKDGQTLAKIKYFTARVSGDPDKEKRQSDFLDAISTLSCIKIIEGRYEPTKCICRRCYWLNEMPNEKMTDVNIAVEMIRDAYCDAFDVAFLVSGDSDLTAPIVAIRELFPDKPVVLIFPPNRFSKSLSNNKLVMSGGG